MIYKIISLIACSSLLFFSVSCTDIEEPVLVETVAEMTTVPQEINISAPHAGLYNAETVKCLYSKASDERIYPASLTKIVTACTALKYVSADSVFKVGTELHLVPEGSSLCLIQQGHRLKLRDLLTGMLMCSGNDAAYTVAVNIAKVVSGNRNMTDSQSVEYFCFLMNNLASDIGAKDSNFTNPDGWDSEMQYSTIHDLALISSYAMQIEEIRNIVSMQKKYVLFESGENITWNNTNKLLDPESDYYLSQAIGLKTGTTEKAGNCLIAVLNVNNKEYISVITGCDSDNSRYETVHQLIKLIN